MTRGRLPSRLKRATITAQDRRRGFEVLAYDVDRPHMWGLDSPVAMAVYDQINIKGVAEC